MLERRDQALAVPESLLQFEGEKPFVEVLTGPQVFEKRFIQVGLSDGIHIEVVSGIETDAKIKIWSKPIVN